MSSQADQNECPDAMHLSRNDNFDQFLATTQKWCEIECKLVLFTNRKSHMGFHLGLQLVPKSVTSNDPEWHDGHFVLFLYCTTVLSWEEGHQSAFIK